jgi:hypothetical protein
MCWWLLVLVACSSNDPWCTPPKHTTYSCQPIPTATTVDCVGGPTPDCSPFYKGSPRAFTCESGHWGELL